MTHARLEIKYYTCTYVVMQPVMYKMLCMCVFETGKFFPPNSVIQRRESCQCNHAYMIHNQLCSTQINHNRIPNHTYSDIMRSLCEHLLKFKADQKIIMTVSLI